jgi:Polyketide cyclase / dehydrase and lipid transport
MGTWTTQTWLAGTPEMVLDLLTEPDAIARWAPIPFEVLSLDGTRLEPGTRARVRGALAGRSMEFDVDIRAADSQRVELVADGPVSIGAEYRLSPLDGGSEVSASVSVSGHGLLGGVLARAADAVLAAGALHASLARIDHALEPALAA